MSSTRQQILEATRTRLQAIAVASGFNTNAGSNVFLGDAPAFGPDDPDVAILLVVGDDGVRRQGENLFIDLPLTIAALARADLPTPWTAVEGLVADIKKAIELTDRTLGGLVPKELERGATRTIPRDSGTNAVGTSITYTAPYLERWGQP